MPPAGKQKEGFSQDGDLNDVPTPEPPEAEDDGAVGGTNVTDASTPDVPDADVAGEFLDISTEYLQLS